MMHLNSVLLEGEVREIIRGDSDAIDRILIFNNKAIAHRNEEEEDSLVSVDFVRLSEHVVRLLKVGAQLRVIGYLVVEKELLCVRAEHLEVRPAAIPQPA